MLVSPSRTIRIGEQDYKLDGSFSTLRAVQESFKLDVVQVLISLMDMRLDEVARLIALGSGQAVDGIGESILDSIGAMTAEYARLKTELVAWLNVAITPKAEREKKSAEMEALIRSSSPGPTTSVSPSGLSAGSPENSGEAMSGS